MKVKAIVERGKGKRNFSCFAVGIDRYSPIGYGRSAREAMDDIKAAYRDLKDYASVKGETLPEIEFEYLFDVGAFFDFYPIDISAFARRIGMNASLLRGYATAIREPKPAQLAKIRAGIDALAKDLGANLLIEKSVTDYSE